MQAGSTEDGSQRPLQQASNRTRPRITLGNKRPVACHRCHAQKVKCSGETPCSRCNMAGCANECSYVVRDRKVRVDESYLERLIEDSEELRQYRLNSRNTICNSLESGHPSTEKNDFNPHNPLLEDRPWFQTHEGLALPVFISEAACTGFATRLCQCLDGEGIVVSHIPRMQYVAEPTLNQLSQTGVQWPSLSRARLLVKTALGHISPPFHVALVKSTIEYLHGIYERRAFDDPVLSCKYFALFALGELYSISNDRTTQGMVPGMAYYARAIGLTPVLPERPTIMHIESLLMLALYSQSLNRQHSAYLMVGTALRFALFLGLNHNIPDCHCPDRKAREHRARLWWTIYIFDRSWGLKLGLPGQTNDEDIQVGLPIDLDDEVYRDEFVDSAYQVAFIKLARISTQIMRTIYSRKQFPETFLQREQSILLKLQQWMQSLPEHLRLHTSNHNPKCTILIHLQFNYCVILAIRPILLGILNHLTSGPESTIRPTLVALKDACIHSARHTLILCADEWTNGSSSTYGYAFAQYIFTSALILIISSLLPGGTAEDFASVDTAVEMLNSLVANGSLVADDLYQHLIRAQNCLRTGRFASRFPITESETNHYLNTSFSPPDNFSHNPNLDVQSLNPSTMIHTPGLGNAVTGDPMYLTAEMALYQPLMQDFLTQSVGDLGCLDIPEVPAAGSDVWPGLPLWTTW
ncbi:uncharacterized protein BO97DRAFT_168384 [Aspergillus homomorphus CBS 101889]|uniref:Zn(2)-C6 fungal-type domain-containing protein n=1 Tax=Aspergillus homomorphus (strain CBS 101889) TaxID=1450537 RepID=A0A395HNL5_ASPHC|nr:hypothetical protein BO97DRAFT_168384 [Aspergillus homomorphus CBS 101889]RAL09417.1 hypothetical protein BO97DRAFT_168384 [Aspergillus homomorphus CBS 101889]